MLKISRRVRERPIRLFIAGGAVWLAILFAATFYAGQVPASAQSATAVFELPHPGERASAGSEMDGSLCTCALRYFYHP